MTRPPEVVKTSGGLLALGPRRTPPLPGDLADGGEPLSYVKMSRLAKAVIANAIRTQVPASMLRTAAQGKSPWMG